MSEGMLEKRFATAKDGEMEKAQKGFIYCSRLFTHLLSTHASPMRRVCGHGVMGVEGRSLPLAGP